MTEETDADGSRGCSCLRIAMQLAKPAQSCAEHDQLDDGQDYFVDHVKEVLGLRAFVERISEKYFDHYQGAVEIRGPIAGAFRAVYAPDYGLPEDALVFQTWALSQRKSDIARR